MKSHQIIEVNASSTPKEVIGAIVAGSPKTTASSPIKWFHLGFVFILVFAVVIYFREEIYTFSKDVQKHPILAAVENQQLHKYLGGNWVFGNGDSKEAGGSTQPLTLDDPAAANSTNVTARALA